MLPDSFRWHLAEHPVTNWLRDVDERFARPRSGSMPPHEHLAGSYYFFGYNNPGHFGHLMTEAVAKLWGWDAAKAADPSLKILCREHPKRPGTAGERLENVLLPAYGIDPDDIVWATGPVTVDDLVGATPLWHNAPPYYVHPALLDDWRRLRDGLPRVRCRRAQDLRHPPGGTNRFCRNGREWRPLREPRVRRPAAREASLSPSRPPSSHRRAWSPASAGPGCSTCCSPTPSRP